MRWRQQCLQCRTHSSGCGGGRCGNVCCTCPECSSSRCGADGNEGCSGGCQGGRQPGGAEHHPRYDTLLGCSLRDVCRSLHSRAVGVNQLVAQPPRLQCLWQVRQRLVPSKDSYGTRVHSRAGTQSSSQCGRCWATHVYFPELVFAATHQWVGCLAPDAVHWRVACPRSNF